MIKSKGMYKSLFAIVTFVLLSVSMVAQVPKNIVLKGRLGAPSASRGLCNEAGTFTLGTLTGQSNDVTPDSIYLCFGDVLPILHNGDFDLSGDPQSTTAPGIGYAFYDCRPTVEGPDLATIVADGCVNQTSPIFVGGIPFPQINNIWVFTGLDPGGNIDLINDGNVQRAFNNDNIVGTSFWIAPITVDEFASQGYESSGGGPVGPCVDVNHEAAIFVTWLSPIDTANVQNTLNSAVCEGSFELQGGLPEIDPTTTYDIDISLNTDNTVKGTIINGTSSGDRFEFRVPQAGVYTINVEDGKSCGITFEVDMGACNVITLSLPFQNVAPGSNVCLDVFVEGFNDVSGGQFTYTYDPTVLSYTGVGAVNPLAAAVNIFDNSAVAGEIAIQWTSFPNIVSIPDGESFFQLCFDVVGAIGDYSDINIIDGNPTFIEISVEPNTIAGVHINAGQVNVSTDVLFAGFNVDSLTCDYNDDGVIEVIAAQGTPPYTLTWNTEIPSGPDSGPEPILTDGGSFQITDLAEGTYSITITDSALPTPNERIDVIEVGTPPNVFASFNFTQPSCNGFMDGALEVELSLDGVAQTTVPDGFSFNWSVPGSEDSPILDSLAASNNYAVTITYADVCEVTLTTPLANPPAIDIPLINRNITDASCSGVSDGEITVQATGGTTDVTNGYTYAWPESFTSMGLTSTYSNINPGSYVVTVSDDNMCVDSFSITVNAAKTLSLTPALTQVSCNSLCDGQIFVNGETTGAPADTPYTFAWNSSTSAPVNTSTTSTNSGLCAGTYFVTMTDASPAACEVIDTFEIIEPEALALSVLEQINETCTTGNDGSLTIGVTGGTYPYMYVWSHDATETDSIATGLASLSPASYILNVTDANSCTEMISAEILAPQPATINMLNDASVSCANSTDGALTVSYTAGAAPITSVDWTHLETGDTFSGDNLSNLSPGTYVVTITDSGQCTTIDTAEVISPEPLSIIDTTLVLPQCPGATNGQIAVNIAGGTPPYDYIWSTNPGVETSFNPITGLQAGSYSVTVIDANDCEELVIDVELPDPPSIVVDFSNIVDVTCPDDATFDGQITADAMYSDGTAGSFNFTWSSTGDVMLGQSSVSVNNLGRGIQSLNVSDGTCNEDFDFEIGSPEDIVVQVAAVEPTCHGDNDGSIILTPSGGTGGFTYQWQGLPGETSPSVNNLIGGQYIAVLTDANACTFSQTVVLDQPDELILSIDTDNSTPFVSCNGQADGAVTVFYNETDQINPVGANPYTWSGNVASSASASATELLPGTYTVTITDTRGCTDEVSYTIDQPEPIVFTVATPEVPLCYGDQTLVFIESATGGAGAAFEDFQFILDNNGLAYPVTQGAPVFAGDHTVTVIDPAGCTNETEISISQPTQLVINMPDELVVELGDTLTRINPIVSGGTQPYFSYIWTPSDYLSSDTILSPTINPLDNQEYTFTVIDDNGCVASDAIYVILDANRNFFIPNVFSPNGDGPNDEFRVFACQGVQSINYARIYNRWGALIHESTNVPLACEGGGIVWDGTFNGRNVDTGVYVYMIEVTFWDGVTLLYRGDVAITY